jgi:hypothetical protein
VDDTCNIPLASAGQILYENDGSGWRSIYHRSVATGAKGLLVGDGAGNLVIAGDTGGNGACDVVLVKENGEASCIWTGMEFAASAAVAAGSDVLLLGRYTDAQTATKLVKYDGKSWTEIGSWPWPDVIPTTVATAGSTVVVAGGGQLAWAGDIASGSLTQLPKVPAGDYTAAWIYGLNDVYLGNAIGQMVHYDGAQWTTQETGLDQVVRIWASGDHTLFAYSAMQLVRIEGGISKSIWRFDGDASQSAIVMDMWGNASTELFLAVKDFAFSKYACGPTFLLWFDGSSVHRF